MSTDKNNYYKDLWNDPRTEAGQFFNKVNFNSKGYQLQEHIFKQCLWSIKNLREWSADQDDIKTVLEAGCGDGRMTKIMLEELPSIEYYVAMDISEPSKFFIDNENKIRYIKDDIMNINHSGNFDCVLTSELLMHIKPEHIERVIKSLTNLLAPQGIIINIDWFYNEEPSPWCYIHDYDKLYRINGLQPVITSNIESIDQKLFCYGR